MKRLSLLFVVLSSTPAAAVADEPLHLPMMATGWRVELPAGQVWMPRVQDGMDFVIRMKPSPPSMKILFMPHFLPCAEAIPDMAPRLSGQLRTAAPYAPANWHAVTIERPADVTLCMDTPKRSYMAIVVYDGDRASADFASLAPFLHNVAVSAGIVGTAPPAPATPNTAPPPPSAQPPNELTTLRVNGLRR